ncbi:hypothetical protein [Neisseria sp. Ec49-e6-T10]|uniref:hypothetical protein n=1 Tax=Neisseria sp. Ec49-e6-T10 TaxID=3140744 RepID=UPI003EBB464D
MITLEEFIEQEKTVGRSKLEPFKSDILTLKKKGYTEVAIRKYLAMNDVTVSQRGLNLFIKKNINTEITPKTEPTKRIFEEKNVNKVSAKKTEPRKFDWQTPVDKADII